MWVNFQMQRDDYQPHFPIFDFILGVPLVGEEAVGGGVKGNLLRLAGLPGVSERHWKGQECTPQGLHPRKCQKTANSDLKHKPTLLLKKYKKPPWLRKKRRRRNWIRMHRKRWAAPALLLRKKEGPPLQLFKEVQAEGLPETVLQVWKNGARVPE